LHGALLAVSPLSLIGAKTPIERASVSDISTCVAFLTGPNIETFFNSFFGPITSILSLAAY